MRVRQSGFTLIELMVVIAILAALMAGGTIMLNLAAKKREEALTQQRVTNLGAAIDQLRDGSQLTYFPPTLTSELRGPNGEKVGEKVGLANETNVGIETLYIAFRMKGITVRPEGLDAEDAFENWDEDQANGLAGDMTSVELFEYVDAWGYPLVYLHSRDYKDPRKVERYVLEDGSEIKVAPRRSGKSGEFFRAASFQLFSIGPDGEPGTDDDVHYGQ